MSKFIIPMLVGITLAIAGCDNTPRAPTMPEVNDANCQMAEIMKIEDKATQETFAGLCSRRPASGGIAPTEQPLNWLELTAPQEQESN
ncbi:entry exclusion lipoprotein TrbK [Pseudomonas sp. CW003PS]|nr:entry exclusion lipoprotein TrbK [Pseudomonas sp. CW003PS]